MQKSSQQQPDRSVAPAFRPVTDLKVQEAVQFHLDNGIKVYSINAGFQDLVRIEFLFDNKNYYPDSPIIATASNRLLTEGTKKHTALQLAEMVDDYGAFLETEESADSCSLVLYTLNKHLEKTLPVVFEVLTEANYPENELTIYCRNQKQRLTVNNEKVNAIARGKFNEVIFGSSHPYGHYVTAADYDLLNVDALRSYHAPHYSATHCTILAAGMLSESTNKLINKFFGGSEWSSPIDEKVSSGTLAESGQKIHFHLKDNAIQTAIRIGRRMFTRTHEDYPGMTVLNTVLGGYFGSRLMSNIREDKGYTYGIGSAVASFRQAGCFFISTEVGADLSNAALEEIYKEIQKLIDEPVGLAELSMVRNYLLGSFLKGIDGPFALIDRCKTLLQSGLDYDYFKRYVDTVAAITPDQLQSLANRYWKREDLYELVVGVK